jgi:hypothetical protein
MTRFLFQVQPGRCPEFPVIEDDLSGIDAARKVALEMWVDLALDIVAGLAENPEWRLDVMDEFGKPVFRLKVVAESLAHSP